MQLPVTLSRAAHDLTGVDLPAAGCLLLLLCLLMPITGGGGPRGGIGRAGTRTPATAGAIPRVGGWAGKLVGYESKNQKMKVKIHGDVGYEHLTIKGTGAYALHSLVRLI